jgi:hypothetical protein
MNLNLSNLTSIFSIFLIHFLLHSRYLINNSSICWKTRIICLISWCSISSITRWIKTTSRTTTWFYIRIFSSTICSSILFSLARNLFFIFFNLLYSNLLTYAFLILYYPSINLILRFLNLLNLLFSRLVQIFWFCYEFLKFLNKKWVEKCLYLLTFKISLLIATSIADLSSLLFANKYGFLVNKNFRQYLWPYSEQKWHGVLLSISFALMSAPCWTNAWITLRFPLRHAICRGVLKLLVLAST